MHTQRPGIGNDVPVLAGALGASPVIFGFGCFGLHHLKRMGAKKWCSVNIFSKIEFLSTLPGAMPRKHSLPSREIEMARRLVSARKKFRRSRAGLSEVAEVDAGELTRVELCRVRLRYGLAWSLISYMDLNPRWLVTGEGDWRLRMAIPAAIALGVAEDMAFVEVYDSKLAEYLTPKIPAKPAFNGEELPPDALGRFTAFQVLQMHLKKWLIVVPDSHLNALSDTVTGAGERFMTAHAKDDWLPILQRYVNWAELEKEAGPKGNKDYLDSKGAVGSVVDMRSIPTWPRLRKLIVEQTSERGAKAALAKSLGVSPQVLNNWLADREQGAPNAELTLKLLGMFWKPAK